MNIYHTLDESTEEFYKNEIKKAVAEEKAKRKEAVAKARTEEKAKRKEAIAKAKAKERDFIYNRLLKNGFSEKEANEMIYNND